MTRSWSIKVSVICLSGLKFIQVSLVSLVLLSVFPSVIFLLSSHWNRDKVMKLNANCDTYCQLCQMWSKFWKCGQNYRNLVKHPQEKEETFDNCAQCTLYIYYYSSLAVTLIWIYHQRGPSPSLAEYCPCCQTEIFIIFLFWHLRISTRFLQVLKVYLLQKDKIMIETLARVGPQNSFHVGGAALEEWCTTASAWSAKILRI